MPTEMNGVKTATWSLDRQNMQVQGQVKNVKVTRPLKYFSTK